MESNMITAIFFIFTGAAVLSTVALFTRQSMLVAYMVLGILLGPHGFELINQTQAVSSIGKIGIIFLLFLLGLHLPPQKLIGMLKKISLVGVVSSLAFAAIGFGVSSFFGFNVKDSVVIGAAMMFSSTIIGIKLLPTTVLHHQHTGEMMISVLLFQDLLAILVLLLLKVFTFQGSIVKDVAIVMVGFPLVLLFAFVFQRVCLMWLFKKFSRIKEYMFLVSIAWCLSMVELAELLKLSDEIGAFIAGVSLAASPISVYIAESLKPVRDFFLVMFFFSVGALFNLSYVGQVIYPALILGFVLFGLKPLIYKYLLTRVGEAADVSWEVGVRLGQISEFSIIISIMMLEAQPLFITSRACYLIQAATMISFVLSSYWVVMKYPTPVALSDKLRRD